jgi:hypothetical protein
MFFRIKINQTSTLVKSEKRIERSKEATREIGEPAHEKIRIRKYKQGNKKNKENEEESRKKEYS